MARPLDNQVVVITGASSGIGRETAMRLAGRGAKVIVSARRDEALDDLVSEIKAAGGEATSVPVDVSKFEEVEALARLAAETYGRIDTWVNNAGVLIVGDFEETDLEEARRLFDVNFWGEVHGMKAVLPIMREQGEGTIINVTSMTARRPLPLMSVYSASKSAVNGLTEALRAEIKGSGIELCLVMPATIDTPLYANARSKEGVSPRAVPPIYPPSEVARAIEKAAESPTRDIYAGPAGMLFNLSNIIMPGLLDKALGKFTRPALLTDRPEPASGTDNLDSPRHDTPATTSGGWRTPQYKA
ncbi:MAG: SDR family oxidoreductase, partial [Chloroflexota bacterium]|nr:SDR family oxidoreductase [Chloroflexota bacterium]